MILTDPLNSAYYSIEMKTTKALVVRRIDASASTVTK